MGKKLPIITEKLDWTLLSYRITINILPKYINVPTIAAFLVESKSELNMKLIDKVLNPRHRNTINTAK